MVRKGEFRRSSPLDIRNRKTEQNPKLKELFKKRKKVTRIATKVFAFAQITLHITVTILTYAKTK